MTPFGRIAEQDLLDLPRHFDGVTVLQYVIMPDHIHILLQLGCCRTGGGVKTPPLQSPRIRGRPRPAVPTMIGQYKSGVSRRCGRALWQTSYYDHVVRNEAELLEIRRYIEKQSPAMAAGRQGVDLPLPCRAGSYPAAVRVLNPTVPGLPAHPSPNRIYYLLSLTLS